MPRRIDAAILTAEALAVKIILHIGMPKAGSTALQAALVAARRPLRKAGVLYPKGAFNHNFLVAGVAPPDRLGRVFAQQYQGDADRIRVDFAAFWQGIVAAIDRRRPEVVVLSAETMFSGLWSGGPEPLRRLVAPLDARLEIVCYVRRPSDYYLSMAQQQLKASSTLPVAGPVGYRRPLEAARAVADAVHVIAYDRAQFPDGDIVADFATRFLPAAGAGLRAVPDPKVKPSMSAEAMDIVQAFRRERLLEGLDAGQQVAHARMADLGGVELERARAGPPAGACMDHDAGSVVEVGAHPVENGGLRRDSEGVALGRVAQIEEHEVLPAGRPQHLALDPDRPHAVHVLADLRAEVVDGPRPLRARLRGRARQGCGSIGLPRGVVGGEVAVGHASQPAT